MAEVEVMAEVKVMAEVEVMAKVEVGGLLVMPIVMVRQLLAGEESRLLGESKNQEIGPVVKNDDDEAIKLTPV